MADETKKQRLYLRKNDLSKNEKLPYFTLCVIPEEGADDAEWEEIAAFWKAKSGVGYSGIATEGLVIDTSKMKRFEKKQKGETSDPATD